MAEPKSTTPDESAEKLSMNDLAKSLTGYEEDEIEERFEHPIGVLLAHRVTKAGRAFIYITQRRADVKAAVAYKAAMEMRLADVNDRFLEEDEDGDDFDPDSPDTDQGKDDSPSD